MSKTLKRTSYLRTHHDLLRVVLQWRSPSAPGMSILAHYEQTGKLTDAEIRTIKLRANALEPGIWFDLPTRSNGTCSSFDDGIRRIVAQLVEHDKNNPKPVAHAEITKVDIRPRPQFPEVLITVALDGVHHQIRLTCNRQHTNLGAHAGSDDSVMKIAAAIFEPICEFAEQHPTWMEYQTTRLYHAQQRKLQQRLKKAAHCAFECGHERHEAQELIGKAYDLEAVRDVLDS